MAGLLFHPFVNINALFYLDIPNLPPTVSADENDRKSSDKASCTSPSGKVYTDGAYFVSNQTGIRPTRDNQCVVCNCQVGVIEIRSFLTNPSTHRRLWCSTKEYVLGNEWLTYLSLISI